MREELCCSAVANALAPVPPMELYWSQREVREELCCRNAFAPEVLMKLCERSSVVREELCCSAVANALTPESKMELSERSRRVREELCGNARETEKFRQYEVASEDPIHNNSVINGCLRI